MNPEAATRRSSGVPAPLRGFRAAFVFLTRIPVGGFPYEEDFRWASAHFPAVGLVVGGVTGASFVALSPLGPAVAAVLAVGLSVLLTGAFHEDGLADTFDALGGSQGRERIFEILKDSRIGTFGGSALALSFALRTAALAELGGAACGALVFGHAAARAAPVWLMTALPYVSGSGGKGASVVRGGALPQAMASTLWGGVACVVALALGLPPVALLSATAAAAIVAVLSGRWYRARAGGVTGDFLGATEQLCEMAILVAILACVRTAR